MHGQSLTPIFTGDTVFASTEIVAKRDYPGRSDLGLLEVTLRGHKHDRSDEGEKPVEIFYLERALAVKRRSHYL